MNRIMKGILAVSVIFSGVMVTLAFYNHSSSNDTNCQIVVTAPKLFQHGKIITIDASASSVDSLTWAIFPTAHNFKVIGRQVVFMGDSLVDEYTIIVSGQRGGKSAQRTIVIQRGYDTNTTISEFQNQVISRIPVTKVPIR